MNYFAVSALINCLTSCLIAALVKSKTNQTNKTSKLFIYFAITVALWSMCYFIWQICNSEIIARFFLRLLFFPAILIPAIFYHFISELVGSKTAPKTIILTNYILSGFFWLMVPTRFFLINEESAVTINAWPKAGVFFSIFILYFFMVAVSAHYMLWRAMKTSMDQKKVSQLRYVFFGTMIGFLGGSTNYFLFYSLPISPYGNIFVSFYVAMIGYAIVRHNLLEIKVIVRRTAVFTGLFVFVYSVFTIITVLGQEFFRATLGWNQWVAMIPTVAIITFSLRPLEIFLTNTTDKYLFQKKYDYRELLKVFTNEILTVIDLKKLTQDTVESLISIMKLESASILLHDREAKNYTMVASHGVKDKEVVFKSEDLLISYHKKGSGPIQADKRVSQMEDGELKKAFMMLNAKICIPIELQDELIGVLGLGAKKSGEDFTQDDIDILMTLARTEAIAISNARLFEELSKTQAEAAQREKMAVIGTLAAGINHEICNPLGIVRGQCEMFLLNARDGFYAAKTPEEMMKISSEIMTKVIRETDRATGITKKLSSFAKPSKRSDFEEVSVEREVDEVTGLIGHDLKLSNIDIQKDFPDDFPLILADKKQIQEVFFNIIRNAAQAMDKKEGKIVVSGFQEGRMAVIRVADNGSGIPPDKVEQIFHPFYTTKSPGKGTGLGLFIVKQVVERNNGKISVESELGVGTTFTLRFVTAVSALVNRAH